METMHAITLDCSKLFLGENPEETIKAIIEIIEEGK